MKKTTYQKWAEIWRVGKKGEKCKNGLFKPFSAKFIDIRYYLICPNIPSNSIPTRAT